MFRLPRKFVAILLLLWLPLFSSNALAASVYMQMQQGGCHDAAESQVMSHEDMGEHHQYHGEMPAASDDQSTSCNACGICHLACTGYLSVPEVDMVVTQTAAREATLYLVAFHSITSVPLVPPPLVRA